MFSALNLLALGLLHICAFVAAGHALLTKEDPRSALGWICALVFLPVVGVVVYLIFGISREHSRAEYLMRKIGAISAAILPVRVYPDQEDLPQAAARRMAALGRRLTGETLCPGNAIVPLHNGDEAYPAMLAAINAAKEHVFLGTYIFNYGHAAQKFIAALLAAHTRGVDVRVLVDGVGRLYSWRHPVKILAREGVKTTVFRPLRLYPPNFGINLRSHRKVLICDNTAFTGGMNIADGNLLHFEPDVGGKIQDMQFCCKGPVVAQLCRAFLMNWAFCTNDMTQVPPLRLEKHGNCDCRVVVDGIGKDGEALNDLICGVVNMARERIFIMTPYFLPPLSLEAALHSAALRGVDVRLVLPAHNNLAYMAWAAEHVLPRLLRAGGRVWYQKPPFAHTKLFLVDDFYSLVGSANMDSRSLLLNFELNVEIFDQGFNETIAQFMETTMAEGSEIFLSGLDMLPLWKSLRNAVCWVFSPYF